MIQNVESFVKSRLWYLYEAMDTDERKSLKSAFKEYSETVIDECSQIALVDVITEVEDDSEHGCHDEISDSVHQWSLGAAWKVRASESSILQVKQQL